MRRASPVDAGSLRKGTASPTGFVTPIVDSVVTRGVLHVVLGHVDPATSKRREIFT